VLAATDIKQTFLKMIGPQHLDASFIQRIKDINLKGGSLYVSHFLLKGPARYRSDITPEKWMAARGRTSRDMFYEHIVDVDGLKGSPVMAPDIVVQVSAANLGLPGDACDIPGYYLVSPSYVNVPPPEYLVGGPEAIDREKAKWDAYMLKAWGQLMEMDNVVKMWSNTPWESEHRNVGLLGGNWGATRHGRDQWGENRPNALLPELSRYRSPIDGLYLCHQSSCHPGGACLMAVPYNLMHILIEDGLVEPGDWWYPTPWYIPQEGKISAKAR